MNKPKTYINLMRPKHYLKNFLIVVPLFFDLNIFDKEQLFRVVLGFIAFSLLSSSIYIINDIQDVDSDRKSETKKNRPIAAGAVGIGEAVALAVILLLAVAGISYVLQWKGLVWVLLYFVLNIAYSIKLKHIPIVDVTILASGFLIRLLYGAAITDITISSWLCMTVIAISFYMGLGKRRNELVKHGAGESENAVSVRGVLKFYNEAFLDKNMYMLLGMGIVFYALWSSAETTIEKIGSNATIWTVPIVIILAMRYSLDIEKDESGDPIEVMLSDKWLVVIAAIYVAVITFILYFA